MRTRLFAAIYVFIPMVAWAAQTVSDPMTKTDADMKAVLDAQADLNPAAIEASTVNFARQQPTPADGAQAVMKKKLIDPADTMGISTTQIQIDGAEGKLPATLYKPMDIRSGKLVPVVVYFHGGGWVLASNETYDATPRVMARQTDAIFVSVEYRKAPEAKFPAAHDDAFAAYKWVLTHAQEFGGDPSRVAVMGESAGGNLAINVSIAARDAKIQLPIYQVLVYPVAGVDMNTPSYLENATAKPLNRSMMQWFVNNATDGHNNLQDPRLDLVGKADMHGLPPTTVITAQIDPLRSEGEALAQKLQNAGVQTRQKTYEGVTHEFFGMGAVVEKAQDAERMAAQDLRSFF